MKSVSSLALIIALGFATPSFSQDASVSAGVDVSASVGGVDASASTGVDASVSASVDPSASAEVSASGEVSGSGEGASSSQMSSSAETEMTCTDLDAGTVATTAMDAAVLANATDVTIFDVATCSGLTLAAMDTTAQANLGANANVAAALAAAGETGAEIVGYTVDGTSLVVYVHKK